MHEMIVVLGLLLGGATLLVAILRVLRQSNIIAFIGVGMVAGLFRERVEIPEALLEIFIEVGIIMLLFMAGLEVDIKSFLRRWRLVAVNGLGQVVLVTVFGLLLGRYYMGLEAPAALIFFALCLTLSSTILVLGTLKEKRAMESLHGQIVLGLMVIQDVIAVLALSFLKSLSSGAPLAVEIPLIFVKMAVLIVVLGLLSRYVLATVFRFFAGSGELLFIGTLGYCMGVAGICEAFHFSPEIGAFFAGASLALLPYRLEIEDKVEPLKSFGVILFFIALGYSLRFEEGMLASLPDVAVLSVFVVLGTPAVMVGLGWLTRLKSHPSLMIGGIINQISEFSLILATLAHQAGVFDETLFTVITLTCLGTFIFSSLGHQYLEHIHHLTRRPLGFIDRRSIPYQIETQTPFRFDAHVVILTFNEISQQIADYYANHGEQVLLIDLDPEINAHFQNRADHNIVPLYADMYDPDVWEEFHFDRAKIIISASVRGQDAELAIARWLREKDLRVPFIATTDSYEEALELYQNGVLYVIQTEYLAAEAFGEIFAHQVELGEEAFRALGQAHHAKIMELKGSMARIFRLV